MGIMLSITQYRICYILESNKKNLYERRNIQSNRMQLHSQFENIIINQVLMIVRVEILKRKRRENRQKEV